MHVHATVHLRGQLYGVISSLLRLCGLLGSVPTEPSWWPNVAFTQWPSHSDHHTLQSVICFHFLTVEITGVWHHFWFQGSGNQIHVWRYMLGKCPTRWAAAPALIAHTSLICVCNFPGTADDECHHNEVALLWDSVFFLPLWFWRKGMQGELYFNLLSPL